MLTEGDVIRMGGKPNPGTKKDKRLKRNKRKTKGKAFARTRSADGRFPI